MNNDMRKNMALCIPFVLIAGVFWAFFVKTLVDATTTPLFWWGMPDQTLFWMYVSTNVLLCSFFAWGGILFTVASYLAASGKADAPLPIRIGKLTFTFNA